MFYQTHPVSNSGRPRRNHRAIHCTIGPGLKWRKRHLLQLRKPIIGRPGMVGWKSTKSRDLYAQIEHHFVHSPALGATACQHKVCAVSANFRAKMVSRIPECVEEYSGRGACVLNFFSRFIQALDSWIMNDGRTHQRTDAPTHRRGCRVVECNC